mmetsp:Transcript_22487/g.62415  ORF Transcript_22487/g.62415 Transcript_22487/m.62415 type:complete len:212 (-) Transcript_22487:117-752(-)
MSGPSSACNPSHFKSAMTEFSDSFVDRATSVSSTRNTKAALAPGKSSCPFLATSQLYSAVLAPPTCRLPVGLGANLMRGGSSSAFLPSNGNLAGKTDVCSSVSLANTKRPLLNPGYRCRFCSTKSIPADPENVSRFRRRPAVLTGFFPVANPRKADGAVKADDNRQRVTASVESNAMRIDNCCISIRYCKRLGFSSFQRLLRSSQPFALKK